MTTIIGFILGLSVLVVVHEWGHYIVAKLCGVRVEVFSIGFGPRLFGKMIGGTDFRVAPIPLGGYVKIHGQDPHEEADGNPALAAAIASDPQSYHSKPVWQKIAIVFAGPAMNLILCFVLMPLVFLIGRTQYKILEEPPVVIGVKESSPAHTAGLEPGDKILSLNGAAVPTWKELMTQISLVPTGGKVDLRYERQGTEIEAVLTTVNNERFKKATGLNQDVSYLGIEYYEFHDNDPVVGEVSQGSPASQAGFMAGDRIIQLSGRPVKYWSEMTERIQVLHQGIALPDTAGGCSLVTSGAMVKEGDAMVGVALTFGIERGGETLTLNVVPQYSDEIGAWIIGVSKGMSPELFSVKRYGLATAIVAGASESVRMLKLTGEVLWGLLRGRVRLSQIGGPLQIAKVTGDAAQAGFGEYLFILAFLSLNLGVMNLLPIPVLDGGHISFMVIEGLWRRPLSPRFRQISTQMGLVTLLLLMLLVTANDLNSVFGVDLLQKLKGLF